GQFFGQRFKTMFVYPQYYIEKYLLSNLVKIRNKILAEGTSYPDPQAVANKNKEEVYVSLKDISDPDFGSYEGNNYDSGPNYLIYFPKDENGRFVAHQKDTIMFLDQQIKSWEDWLKDNEKQKITTQYKDNYSFGAGSSIDITRQVDTTRTHEESFKFLV